MSDDLWATFALDPRSPANAGLRAADRDRDLIHQLLGEAYADGRLDREEFDLRSGQTAAARTLGELPPIVDDLVAPTGSVPALVVSGDLHARAVEKYRSDRREAFMGFLGPSIICVMIWFVLTMGFFWPGFVIAGTGINLVRTLVMRQDIIAGHERKLEKKRLRELEGPEEPGTPGSD